MKRVVALVYKVTNHAVSQSEGNNSALRMSDKSASGGKLMRFLSLIMHYFYWFVYHYDDFIRSLYDMLKETGFSKKRWSKQVAYYKWLEKALMWKGKEILT